MIEMLQRNTSEIPQADDNQDKKEPLDPRVLSSVLISVKLAQSQEDQSQKDPHARLLELMHSSSIRALLDTASVFAQRQGIAPHEGLQQIILSLQEIDGLWNKVLMKEGLARLSSQYH